jgi:Pyruvate/2-oxoacid:ferredoxin oxidoreductase delta subunit
MKVKRKVIEINEDLCNGCGQCIMSCAEGALEIVEDKARLVSEKYCDGLGACLGECPQGALKVVEKDAEDFDECAVEERLESLKRDEPTHEDLACGCPSAQIRTFAPEKRTIESSGTTSAQTAPSTLTHWPVQIRLIPPTAKFLRNADLLIAADCTPVAYPNFHRDFLDGKVVMVGCPKFDDVQDYVERFAGIFTHASIKNVTVVIMEVPCCGGLPMIVKRGMELAGKSIPIEQIVISARGDVLRRDKLVA